MSITTPEKYRRKSLSVPEGESMTEQSHAASCDIHTIMARYEKTGYIDHFNQKSAFYENVCDLPDFKAALDTVREVESTFESLPSDARALFNNNPQEYLDFLQHADLEALQNAQNLQDIKSATPLQGTPEETPTAPPQEPSA